MWITIEASCRPAVCRISRMCEDAVEDVEDAERSCEGDVRAVATGRDWRLDAERVEASKSGIGEGPSSRSINRLSAAASPLQ